jgi:hypothetical protein
MKNTWRVGLVLFGLSLIFSMLICSGLATDTAKRYQMTRAIWTGELPVEPADLINNQFSLGVNGVPQYPYNIGQSIFMLPGDIITTTGLKLVKVSSNVEPILRNYLVALLTFPLISALVILLGYNILLELGFKLKAAVLGALSLLFASTFLHHTQTHQENSLIMLLIFVGMYYHLRWLKQGHWLYLVIASGFVGFLIEVRITNIASIIGETIFIGLAILWRKEPEQGYRRRFTIFLIAQLAGTGLFFFLERAYNFRRFGSWTSTFLSEWINQGFLNESWTEYPRLLSVWNVLFSPERSLFVYDPLLIVLIVIVLLRHFQIEIGGNHYRASYLIAGIVMLAGYLMGYSNWIGWTGGIGWGARYHVPAVHFLILLAVPLVLEYSAHLKRVWRWLLFALVFLAGLVNVISLFLVVSYEMVQHFCLNGTNFYVWQRLVNLVSFATGQLKVETQCIIYGVYFDSKQNDLAPTLNFLPFRAAEFLPTSLSAILLIVWLLGVAFCLSGFIWFIRSINLGAKKITGARTG